MQQWISILLTVVFLGSTIRPSVASSEDRRNSYKERLNSALQMAKDEKYAEASRALYQILRDPRLRDKSAQIRYMLGLVLIEMKMNQVASYQFVDVIKSGDRKYVQNSLERLSMIADDLNNDTLLNYAMKKVKVEDFPSNKRDMVNFRVGETYLLSSSGDNSKEKVSKLKSAIANFRRVPSGSTYFPKAKYLQASGLAELGDTSGALEAFDELIDSRSEFAPTDVNRTAAILGKARVFYQAKKWGESVEYYRRVPKDTELWHDALFELSWALFRSGKFRSALSLFNSLHSTYYDDFYIPESLILRAIVYLYICKYDEMEKVLNIFDSTYANQLKRVNLFMSETGKGSDHRVYLEAIEKIMAAEKKSNQSEKVKGAIPYNIARYVIKEGDFSRSYVYLQKLIEELKRVESQDSSWQNSTVGRYAKKALQLRIKNTRLHIGSMIRNHLIEVRGELRDLEEQVGFLRYEMVNGRKNLVKRKILGKGLEEGRIDDHTDRSFYVQNGYEYWPFQGEYWLDEIGNHHYVGKRSCD